MIDFGKSNYLQKAKKRPDQIKKIFQKIKTDGIIDTFNAVNSKLNQPFPLGYCNVGTIVKSNVEEFNEGQRVVSNSYHSEFVISKKNLMVKIPDNVTSEEACFSILGSIALNSIRQLKSSLGENIVVYGLGLVGLIVCKLLKINGFNVIGIEKNDARCSIAESDDIQVFRYTNEKELEDYILNYTDGYGADAVIIAAQAENQEILNSSAKILKKGGELILLGQVKNEFDRRIFYEKELSFKISSSYGPGRYDHNYELKDIDYPYNHIRWTSNRNISIIIKFLSEKKLSFKNLISRNYEIDKALEAYESINDQSNLAIILNYDVDNITHTNDYKIVLKNKTYSKIDKPVSIGFLGAGNYASRILLPILKKTKNVNLHTLVSLNGLNSKFHAKKNDFSFASSAEGDVIDNHEIDTVFITTRHNLHSEQILKSLETKKNIFVEKPFVLKKEELEKIKKKYEEISSKSDEIIRIVVGYNRRYSNLTKNVKKILSNYKNSKKFVNYTIHAGSLEPDHWILDKNIGGGRFLGEGVHFIDLVNYLLETKIVDYQCVGTKNNGFSINFKYEDNSVACINYITQNSKLLPKENLEIHFNNKTIKINNFSEIKYYNFKFKLDKSLLLSDKGQKNMIDDFINSILKNEKSPMDFNDLIYLYEIILDIDNQLN